MNICYYPLNSVQQVSSPGTPIQLDETSIERKAAKKKEDD